MSDLDRVRREEDPFLCRYQPSELKIASEFLTTWLPFLSRDLCNECTQILADRIRSLDSDPDSSADGTNTDENKPSSSTPNNLESRKACIDLDDDCDENSLGSLKDGAEASAHSLGRSKDGANGQPETSPDDWRSALTLESPISGTPGPRMSWADMSHEDELEEEEEEEEEQRESNRQVVDVGPSAGSASETKTFEKPKLSRELRENIRLMKVKRKKDFICLERVKGKIVNILEGLELHTGVFSAAEQKRIVDFVYEMQEEGQKGELKARTFSAPNKWMRGKGRVTIQFGCCYNYATDKHGNPPGILQHELVDPLPHLFKVIIRRLIRWHVLPPTCVPDSCIVNIYEEGDCIPPHIDNHDFVRPFSTISFLSECDILFGSNLKIVGPGEFSGSYAIPLPVGSVLVLNGNGADVAKHCVPAVPTKRISITFRKMDESKRPIGFVPEPDLQGIQPLPYEGEETRGGNLSKSERNSNNRQHWRREGKAEARNYSERSNAGYEPRSSSQKRRGPPYRRRNEVNLEN